MLQGNHVVMETDASAFLVVILDHKNPKLLWLRWVNSIKYILVYFANWKQTNINVSLTTSEHSQLYRWYPVINFVIYIRCLE